MTNKTKIEWADVSWNPVTGCTKVSQGCKNCYAERMMKRFWPNRNFNNLVFHHDRLHDPSHWRNPRRVFVNSMSDLFHPDVPDTFIWAVFQEMIHGNRRHTYMILTKRPDRMRDWFRKYQGLFWNFHPPDEPQHQYVAAPWPDPCIWLGVSVEDQLTADERIPILLDIPAAVRFVSVEPMLGPVNLTRLKYSDTDWYWDSLTGYQYKPAWPDYQRTNKLNWVIAGGETGPNARPMHPDWALSLRDQCQAAGVPFFFKQWGEWASIGERHLQNGNWIDIGEAMQRVGKKAAGRLLEGREWNEYPEVKP